ncbi:hypothetical protein [Myxococcus sp. RHSTA-1-4]|uniref:hypothetical protein n=1 Tax=Myxococcus sp. RHSTA-1-4 TaxID=2874601 RepID=UPI001CBD72F6|nr:hypothetical protein [Myxococcus sp. RHSTA-1-4]MBZ4417922.1 hypothetical protein [Myxococcus sp. RHSTA-1-4]
MPKLYGGVWPQNVSRLAKYGVRFHEGAWTVAVLHEVGSGLRYLALDDARDDLAGLVNGIKQALGNGPGGAFYVNEYRHVIVPVDSADGTSHYYFAGYLHGELTFHFEGVPLSTRPVQPDGQSLKPGERWVGPRPGVPYVLAAGGSDIYYQTPALTDSDPPAVRPMTTLKVQLSKVLRNSALVRRAVEPVAAIRGYEGGRFYVNEHGAMFTPVDKGDGNGLDYIYCGTIDRAAWFSEPRTS